MIGNNEINMRGGMGIFVLIFFPMLISVMSSFGGGHVFANLCSYIISLFIIIPLIRVRRTHKLEFEILAFLLLLCLFIYSYTYSIAQQAAYEKLILIIYNVLTPSLILIYILKKVPNPQIAINQFVRLATKYSEVILFLFSIFFILGFKDTAIDGRVFLQGFPDPIWASRYSCMLVIFVFYNIHKNGNKGNFFTIVTIFMSLYMIFKGDSRGPLLSSIICLFFMYSKYLSLRQRFLIVVITVLLILLYTLISPRISSGGSDYSTLTRLAMLEQFLDTNFNILRGVGLGSWMMLTTGEDILSYPHNMLVETIVEIGMPGLFLLSYLIIRYFNKRNDSVVFYVCLFFLINAQVSGDVTSNSTFFLFLVLSLSYHAPNCKENILNNKFICI